MLNFHKRYEEYFQTLCARLETEGQRAGAWPKPEICAHKHTPCLLAANCSEVLGTDATLGDPAARARLPRDLEEGMKLPSLGLQHALLEGDLGDRSLVPRT